jgi:hypothetical protein
VGTLPPMRDGVTAIVRGFPHLPVGPAAPAGAIAVGAAPSVRWLARVRALLP